MPTFRISEDVVVYTGDACEKRDQLHCKGRLKTVEGEVASESDHCHAPDAIREEMVYARDEMLSRAQSTQKSTHHVVTNSTRSLSGKGYY